MKTRPASWSSLSVCRDRFMIDGIARRVRLWFFCEAVTTEMLRGIMLAALLLLAAPLACAGEQVTESLPVHHLPMDEAASLVKSALSPSGGVAALNSRRLLVVRDDADHLSAAKALLQKFDQPPAQYRVEMELIVSDEVDAASMQAAQTLPGHWLRLAASAVRSAYSGHRSWSLLLLAGAEGRVMTGEVQPYRQRVRRWLAGYGLVRRDSVNLVALNSGFFVRLQPAGDGAVRVDLEPWMARSQPEVSQDGQPELLVDLGSAGAVNPNPMLNGSPLRLNVTPRLKRAKAVRFAHAATSVVVKLGEEIAIAASGGESALFSRTLLGRHSSVGAQSLVIRLKVYPSEE